MPRHPVSRFDREVALLYFAHRHMGDVADGPLVRFGMGRAHHRALFFVGRRPGLAVKELHTMLAITYQGLHRVLSELVASELLCQVPGETDRRQRHLYLTARGADLEAECAQLQAQLLRDAFERAGDGASFADILDAMTTDADRAIAGTLDLGPDADQSGKTGGRFAKKAASPSR